MVSSSGKQTTIFLNGASRQASYAELCNALYDKSILELAEHPTLSKTALQQRLGSLTYYVNLAAEKLLNCDTPLELDLYNGSWQGAQSLTCKTENSNTETATKWLLKHAQPGLVVPVYVEEQRVEYIELDVVDKIDLDNNKFRLNKHGWFTFDGIHLSCPMTNQGESGATHSPMTSIRVLKPSKGYLTAACCGHCWNLKGKATTPRRLSLRQLLLTTQINWKTYKLHTARK
ncbi:hypothetical protein KIH87_14855 [Paraneptunicella aestuarii]|uniref:hypothetical protein n=1 Tax=Paraneptunicella aestuarii TaxID=2831148 RepID=UPI001E4F16E9|nr:hypothetical protein [Paraneptunicella aestuarii]UAA37959.1 hypothetical protein KIH87_14855 [Paraneptunicella aestuarii]